MAIDHTEKAFEAAIEHHLTTAGGYVTGDGAGFDLERAIFPAEVLAFIKATYEPEAFLSPLKRHSATARMGARKEVA